MNLLVVEMRRAMHRRVVWVLLGLAAALCVVTSLIFLSATSDLEPFEEPPQLTDIWDSSSDGENLLLVGASFLAIGGAIAAASLVGAEWKAGTVATVLTWEPRRPLLHGTRTASAAILAFVLSFGLQVVFIAAFLPGILLNGETDGATGDWWSSLALAMLRISAMTSMLVILAIAISTIGRSTAAALIVLAAWALVVERLIAGLRPGWAQFLIAENVATFVGWEQLDGVEFERGPGVAMATLVLYAVVGALVSGAIFSRRDIAGT